MRTNDTGPGTWDPRAQDPGPCAQDPRIYNQESRTPGLIT